jgi:hypothetical protein
VPSHRRCSVHTESVIAGTTSLATHGRLTHRRRQYTEFSFLHALSSVLQGGDFVRHERVPARKDDRKTLPSPGTESTSVDPR